MTARAIIMGLLGAAFIATAGYFNGQVLHLNHFAGNHFPIIVFGPLLLTMLLANPVLSLLGGRRRLGRGELATIVVMTMTACAIPGSGLLRMFTRCVAMPIHFNQSDTSWQKHRVLSYVPSGMLPNGGQYEEQFIKGFVAGLGEEDNPIGPSEVPWAKWSNTLTVWGPIIVLFAVASISLALIVHGQWSKREGLRYPIAEFADALLSPGESGRPGSILRNRVFWIGACAVFAVHIINGLYGWYPQRMFEVPLSFNFRSVVDRFPGLYQGTQWWAIAYPKIWPTAVAFAVFFASDISFSLGISSYLLAALGIVLFQAGISTAGDDINGGLFIWQRAGSCMALAVALLYMGRRHYWQTFKSALTFRPSSEVEGYAAWACRIFLLSLAGLVVLLVGVGLDWPVAVLVVLLTMLLYLTISRITAEFGLFLAQVVWLPVAVLAGLFGAAALGPQALIVAGLLSLVLVREPHESLMAYVLNGLKICQQQSVAPRRAGWAAGGAFLLALAAGIPFGLWVDHNYGATRGEWWATYGAPKVTFNAAAQTISVLRETGQLKESEGMSAWQRVTAMRPDRKFLWSAGLGLAAALLLYWLRLRFTWWPIHPIILMVWSTWATTQFASSFLLGWVIKEMVVRFGGHAAYRKTKTLMIGVIAGDLLGGMLWMVVGAIYYAAADKMPPVYRAFPSG